MASHHVAVVREERHERLLRLAALVEPVEYPADIVVKVRDHGVVAAELRPGPILRLFRDVRPQHDVLGAEHLLVPGRDRMARVLRLAAGAPVRGLDAEHVEPRPVGTMLAEVLERDVGQSVRLVPADLERFDLVPVAVEGPVEVVRQVEPEPVLEAAPEVGVHPVVLTGPARLRNHVDAVLSRQVPFPYVRGAVAGLPESVGDGPPVVVKDVPVEWHAAGGGVLAGDEPCPEWNADGVVAEDVREPHALRGEAVDVGRLDVRVAAARERVVTKLIAEEPEQVGSSVHARGPFLAAIGSGPHRHGGPSPASARDHTPPTARPPEPGSSRTRRIQGRSHPKANHAVPPKLPFPALRLAE